MMMTPELTGLCLGLCFSIAVFAFKTSVGVFYYLSGVKSFKAKKACILLSSLAYLLLFLMAGGILELWEEPQYLLQMTSFFEWGTTIHLLMAVGFFAWGAWLLQSHQSNCHHKGGWLLILPCPICASAIFLSLAFAKVLFTGLGNRVYLLVPGIFFGVEFGVLGALKQMVKRGVNARDLTGDLMLFIGLYFTGLVLLVPNFDRLEKMYRVVAGAETTPPRLLIMSAVCIIATAGFLSRCCQTYLHKGK